MRCDKCLEHEAIVVFTLVVEDAKTVTHLCAACAASQGLGKNAGSEGNDEASAAQAAGAELAAGAKEYPPMETQRAGNADGLEDEGVLRCSACGLSYEEFKERYRLGCAQCFDAFREQLQPLLRKVQGAEAHTGKHPTGVAERSDEDRAAWALEILTRRLQAAVEREEFEEAARLRDQIELARQAHAAEADRT